VDEGCLKFLLPEQMKQGVFKVTCVSAEFWLNRPKVEWCQPTKLLPRLRENEAAPGQTIQIIGRNFLLDSNLVNKVQVALLNERGKPPS